MKRIDISYQTLQDLKTADYKLRKAIIANCNQGTLKIICKCALNVLRGNISLSACSKRKLRTYKESSQGCGQEIISLRQAKGYNSTWRIPSPAAVCYITHYRRTFIPLALTMLHKMYLDSS